MKKFKVTKERPEYTVLTIRVETEIIKRLDEAALKTDQSRNHVINMALRYAVENMESEE